jgi:hypothetical protein
MQDFPDRECEQQSRGLNSELGQAPDSTMWARASKPVRPSRLGYTA